MPLGIISDSDFECELNDSLVKENQSNPIDGKIIDLPTPGRGEGSLEVPESLRKIIGETSQINGRPQAIELASRFGISPSSVSAYANGSTSTKSYDSPNKDIRDHINKAKERISKKARIRLVHALDALTPEKISGSKAVDIASVAKSMSAVIKDMEPESTNEKGEVNRPQFIFYAPGFKNESSYDAIYSKE